MRSTTGEATLSGRGIILLEGADSAGKTTLARHLAGRYGALNLHSTVRRETYRWHVGALRWAIRAAATRLVVLDRLWISELVYGPIFRGGPTYDVGARCVDRMLRRFGALTIMCVPEDQEAQVRRWEAGRAAGKREHFDRVREVVARYADLYHGNVAHPGGNYVDQLIRFGDFVTRDDVIRYDLDRWDGERGIERFARQAVHYLERLGAAVEPDGPNLAGRAATGWLFVGEAPRPMPRPGAAALPAWPFCDDDARDSSATWLNRALHRLSIREDRLVFVNARCPDDDRLPSLLTKRSGLRPVALGRVAEARLVELGCREFGYVDHPQYARRFQRRAGIAGYAERLHGAMTAGAVVAA